MVKKILENEKLALKTFERYVFIKHQNSMIKI